MELNIPYDLEFEMEKDAIVIAYLADDIIANEFYAALCNMRWKKVTNTPEDEQIINKLKGVDPNIWHCSWRCSGGIIADIRNVHYNRGEDYMDFYCSGNEGFVSDTVKECFERMGWVPHPWDDDFV